MRLNLLYRSVVSGFMAALLCGQSLAGQTCSDKPVDGTVLRNALETGLQLSNVLDELQPRVALIGRVGQDLSAYGLRYSHLGFVSRSAPDQPWRVTHLLNDCGTATSGLWHEGLGNFFLDDMFSFDSLIMVPDEKTQQAVWALINNPGSMNRMHDPSYSVVAYPFSTAHQNSNQWPLELIAEAVGGDRINTRDRAQAWLKANGYQPGTLEIGMFKRLGGRMFKANIAFDGQPGDRRAAGLIDVVTVESIRQFMKSMNMEQTEREVIAKGLVQTAN
ncbi:DUF2145 domain-containing protein [Silvimonas iriomotensis]|uniref:Membrane protein n=1 Tax=Silvimonas iriomotensis TaxID=449662 RepID=A0ABQ2P6E7_9NEIS|nr:DUF2145 domain-containing protein [Silvimonas iriomotensis]GGP19032.1 membrane protein [Silvimonas iriomotensis]